jgi:hypothetical protein
MKKLKHTLAKTQSMIYELIHRPNVNIKNSSIDDQKFIEDIRLKSYSFRRIGF